MEDEPQSQQLHPGKTSKGVNAIEIVVSLVIIGLLLVFLFVPFLPQSDYSAVDYTEYVSSGTTTWPQIGGGWTECVVVVKDNGVGGDYDVTIETQSYGRKTVSQYIDSGGTGTFRARLNGCGRGFTYEVDAPKKMKSVIQIIAGQ